LDGEKACRLLFASQRSAINITDMRASTAIHAFVTDIAKPQRPGMFNPWSQTCPFDAVPYAWQARQARLVQHLQCPAPKLLVIGEAPGFRGCRYSGVPFTSEKLLLDGAIPHVQYAQGHRITRGDRPMTEPSSTIVWKAMYEYQLAEHVVMFNAVPWHPEGTVGSHSNRTPTTDERQVGEHYLKQLLEIFNTLPVVALGNVASQNLTDIGIDHTKVPHPANGGAPAFRQGLRDFTLQLT
jgi:uracil-DNA glycosylase